MTKKIFFAEIDSPAPSIEWISLGEEQRINKINQIVQEINSDFLVELSIVAAKRDGQVVVKLLNSLNASVRGTLLLDFEEFIKKYIDQGLTVWGEALGDKNSLRNLRGIEVKIS
jgi:hypothetical protein